MMQKICPIIKTGSSKRYISTLPTFTFSLMVISISSVQSKVVVGMVRFCIPFWTVSLNNKCPLVFKFSVSYRWNISRGIEGNMHRKGIDLKIRICKLKDGNFLEKSKKFRISEKIVNSKCQYPSKKCKNACPLYYRLASPMNDASPCPTFPNYSNAKK